ncbi:11133_t:CDS:2 [Cetraspora pellucida]|uniref:11133_t:CDS:1 n=1 Tax=Cetraspora pellucida TaxID=1433469 RepID=A0ACA9MT19_9GLOM|nr:11133_t:CDS:2 [Cetraspora pellucida]
MSKSSKYYVVFNGRIPGVYNTLEECDEQVNNVVSSYYKDFLSLDEANETFEKRKKNDSENATSSYLFEFTNILQILENNNDKEKLTISTGNKNIYLIRTENKIANKLARRGAAINMNESKKISPYNAFMKTNLLIIKKNNPDFDHNDAIKLVASMWKNSINNPKNNLLNDV